jgi:phenylpyruvate tautomerase PptA (4-oxalocrotonate tautomerase family)
MPCLEMTLPKLDDSTKTELAERLTSAFAELSGFPGEIFGICFKEYERGNAASGGKIWLGGETRPYLHFLLYSPRLSRAIKQSLVDKFTSIFTDVLGKPEWKPVIHLCEHPYDNVGVDGQLLSDLYEELGNRKFYYDTSDE